VTDEEQVIKGELERTLNDSIKSKRWNSSNSFNRSQPKFSLSEDEKMDMYYDNLLRSDLDPDLLWDVIERGMNPNILNIARDPKSKKEF
jgi:hypothetical protein